MQSINYRGTDKTSEAGRVFWETCRNAINDYLHNHPEINCLFISSDEAPFIDFIGREIISIPMCYHDDQQRSSDGRAIHSSFFGDRPLLTVCFSPGATF